MAEDAERPGFPGRLVGAKPEGEDPSPGAAGTSPLVDVHVHVMGVGDSGPGVWMHPRYRYSPRWAYVVWRLGLTAKWGGIDRQYAERLAASVRGSRLKYAVAQAFDGAYDARGEPDRRRAGWCVSNDYVFALAREFPELLPAGSVNPRRRDWAEELEKCAASGARYVKINPCAMNLDPGEERWRPFYRKLRELGLVLMCHIGPERAVPSFGHELADPARLEPALAEGLTVIAAHAGTAAFFLDRFPYFQRLVALMARHERLYADSSAVAQPLRWHWLRRLASHDLLRSRLLHGSDFPIGPTAFPWSGLSWAAWRRLPRGPDLERDYAIKEAFGLGREAAERGARVLGIQASPMR